MKTTIDLPDDLLIKAKATAARRRTTLKALIEKSLRNEISPVPDLVKENPALYEIGRHGLPVLKKGNRPPVTLEGIHAIQEEIDKEDMRRALNPGQP